MTRHEFLKMLAAAPVAASAGRQASTPVTTAGSPSSVPRAAAPRFPAGATAAVVDFICRTPAGGFPDRAIAEAKRCLVDGFGVILAGATIHGSRIVREHVRASSAPGASTIFGGAGTASAAAGAALANAASGHAMDYDDTQLSSTPDRVFGLLTHPTVPALASALALGERLDASGAVFLDAFLVGFEVECKIAEAINPTHYQRGFHSTGTIGTFAGAASAARLLKLTPAQTAHALG